MRRANEPPEGQIEVGEVWASDADVGEPSRDPEERSTGPS